MLYLFFNTETTGFVKRHLPLSHIDQPRIVQIGMELHDGTHTKCEANFIVNPNVPVPSDASRIHGITTELTQLIGIHPFVALVTFTSLVSKADILIAHNIDYDKDILVGELIRYGFDSSMFVEKEIFCTMKATTNICKLPGKMGNYKWPKLIEAYKQLVNPKGFEGAHDAMADVRACRELYFKLKERKEEAPCTSLLAKQIRGKKRHIWDNVGVCTLCHKSRQQLRKEKVNRTREGTKDICTGSNHGRHVYDNKECIYCGKEEE